MKFEIRSKKVEVKLTKAVQHRPREFYWKVDSTDSRVGCCSGNEGDIDTLRSIVDNTFSLPMKNKFYTVLPIFQ